jgi:hypothetical protein
MQYAKIYLQNTEITPNPAIASPPYDKNEIPIRNPPTAIPRPQAIIISSPIRL